MVVTSGCVSLVKSWSMQLLLFVSMVSQIYQSTKLQETVPEERRRSPVVDGKILSFACMKNIHSCSKS